MLTNSAFWVGVVVALVAMYLWHKYQMRKAGS
jgi:hypothetical protein